LSLSLVGEKEIVFQVAPEPKHATIGMTKVMEDEGDGRKG
jgi:hypothetical protein